MALRMAVKCLGFSGLVQKSAQSCPRSHLRGLDEGDRDALLLDELGDEEVATLDVLRLRVELGVVGDGNARLVVHCQLGRAGVGWCSRAPPGIGGGRQPPWPPRSPP